MTQKLEWKQTDHLLVFNAVGKIVGNCFIWCRQSLDGLLMSLCVFMVCFVCFKCLNKTWVWLSF